MLKYLVVIILFMIGLQTASFGSAQLYEIISVNTSAPVTGTSTLGLSTPAVGTGTQYDAAPYFEAFYSYHGTGVLYFQYDGGSTVTTNSHAMGDLGFFALDNVRDARRIQFLCDTADGTVSATYSTSKNPIP